MAAGQLATSSSVSSDCMGRTEPVVVVVLVLAVLQSNPCCHCQIDKVSGHTRRPKDSHDQQRHPRKQKSSLKTQWVKE